MHAFSYIERGYAGNDPVLQSIAQIAVALDAGRIVTATPHTGKYKLTLWEIG